jgi:hypothetical protein
MQSQLTYTELEQANFPTERQFHILKHFNRVDREYLEDLLNHSEYTREEIEQQLNMNGSKFSEGFISNPDDLWRYLKKTISESGQSFSWDNGKCEIQVSFEISRFPDGIGEDFVIHVSDLPGQIREDLTDDDWKSLQDLDIDAVPKKTWTVHVILGKLNGTPEVVSIFPGVYAPPLPDEELQSEEEFAKNLEFWSMHAVLKK